MEIELLHGFAPVLLTVHLCTRPRHSLRTRSHDPPPEVALQGVLTRCLYSVHQALRDAGCSQSGWCRLVLSGKSELSTANLKILKELSMKSTKLVVHPCNTTVGFEKKCLPTPMYGSVHSGTPNSSFLSPKARKKMYTSKDHKVFQDDIIIRANTVCHRCIEIYNMIMISCNNVIQ